MSDESTDRASELKQDSEAAKAADVTTQAAPAVEPTPHIDKELEEWADSVVISDDQLPSFYQIPNPDPRFFYSWINTNDLNLSYRKNQGWRFVDKTHADCIGLQEAKLDAAGHIKVWDLVLMCIPMKAWHKIDEARRKKLGIGKKPHEGDAAQAFLSMDRPQAGVRTFARDADEQADRDNSRLRRGSRVGYGKG